MWNVVIIDSDNKVDRVLFGFACDSEALNWALGFNASERLSKNTEFSVKAYAVLAECVECMKLEGERDLL